MKQTRKEHPGVLVLDAGDSISGTPVSTMFKGVPIFQVLNKIGYDAAAIGNHEFDYDVRTLKKRVRDFIGSRVLADSEYEE